MEYSKVNLKSNYNKLSPCFRPFLIGDVSNICLHGLHYRFHTKPTYTGTKLTEYYKRPPY